MNCPVCVLSSITEGDERRRITAWVSHCDDNVAMYTAIFDSEVSALPDIDGTRGVLTYLAERGCAALMGHFFTRNP